MNGAFDGYGCWPKGQQLYALNGWRDLNITDKLCWSYPCEAYESHRGVMHCNTDYVDSCLFSDDNYLNYWTCDPTYTTVYDNPIITTLAPSNPPTPSPTPS